MANSQIQWIDTIFDLCVRWLFEAARFLGITYEEINVWLFCIIWPLLTVLLVAGLSLLLQQNRHLKRRLNRSHICGGPNHDQAPLTLGNS